mmetsp:Transcript_20197/g.36605  ORF Transcript_20197/g.36605 Transcript_20197/m.36605 type:complete len:580 (-) Transcript_20197:127-1866(-)
MGVLKKLAFWKKTKESTPVKPFVEEKADGKSPEGTAWDSLQQLEETVVPPEPRSPSLASQPVHEGGDALAGTSSPVAAEKPAAVEAAASPLRPRIEAIEASPPRQSPLSTDLADSVSPKVPPPVPSEVESPEDSFRINLPQAQVFANVGDAFGHMIAQSIQSSKWDQRTQALKSIGAVLKGLDLKGMAKPGSTCPAGVGLKLRDRVGCWRSSVQLLNMIMKDKVIPVRLACNELFVETFSHVAGVIAEDDVQLALCSLVPALLERLGDSNLRLHESARKCVFHCAEEEGLLGLEGVLQKLRKQLDVKHKSSDRSKTLFGILDTVNFLVRHFPGHRQETIPSEEDNDELCIAGSYWTQDDVLPFIVAGMHDSNGPRIRNSAVQLAVTVYATFGMEAVEPMLASMRPAIQTLLRQKFREYEEDDLEEFSGGPVLNGAVKPTGDAGLDGLVVCGVAVQAPKDHAVKVTKKPSIPGGVPHEDEEECIMDTILEEAGMVFGAGHVIPMDKGHKGGRSKNHHHSFHVGFDFEQEQMSVFEMSEEHRLLEDELFDMGLDLDTLGEEQEVLMNCRPQKGMPRTMEVF